jgi:hypothetical protein
MKNAQYSAIVGTAFALSLTSAASASFTNSFDSAMSFGGSSMFGTPNANFVRSYNAAEGIEIGMKAVTRFGDDVANTGDRYSVDPGPSGSGPLANWDYVMALDLGGRTIGDFEVILSIDFDGAAGVTDFLLLDFNDPSIGGSSSGNFIDRQNLGDSFWPFFGAPPFDVNAIGDYEIVLSISSLTGELLAESRIFADNNVQVVPVPTAALAGLGLLGSMGAYRRIRK